VSCPTCGYRVKLTWRRFTATSRRERPRTVGATTHDDDVTDEEPEAGNARVFDRLLTGGLPVWRVHREAQDTGLADRGDPRGGAHWSRCGTAVPLQPAAATTTSS